MANKTDIVDPNNPNGLINSVFNNTPVALDDLTISVELTTEKKGRTLLVSDKNIATAESTDSVRINFIEGSNVNGKRTLTTKFTDLTTSLDSNNNPETLGISAIDIEFNTGFAPLVTIQFIDVRGSSVFQNEDKMGDNKYSVFFQLPYPLYNLTIKGYYGQPVSYCLHMTKFTSRFNSQTGNFEMTTSFIGYTYAMLSDLLLGYLKAIPYTKIGAEKYKVLKDEDNTIYTLDELYKKISQIDSSAKGILADNDDYKNLSFYVTKLEQLEVIKNNLNALNSFDVNSNEFAISDVSLVDTATYVKNIESSVEEYNNGNKLSLDTTSFNKIDPIVTTKTELLQPPPLGNGVTDTDRAILAFIDSQSSIEISEDKVLTIIDNRERLKQIDSRKERIDSEIKILKNSIAKQLEINIVGKLGFNPTIRTIMKSITSAAEVFLQTIYTVSAIAEADTDRTKELDDNFQFLDIKQNAAGNTPANSSSQELTKIFYPWPAYKNKNNVETYLGQKNELNNPNNITEVRFIDELLKAFLESDRQTQIIESEIRQNITSWIPTNPLDTRLFNEVFPYKRMEFLNTDDVMLMILIRAMTFLGVSNLNLTDDEIIKMAEAEINAIIADLENKGLIDELKSKQTNDFLNVVANINNKPSRVVKESMLQGKKSIIYNYILDANDVKVIPINGDFKDAGVSNYVLLNNVNNSTWPTKVEDLATKAADGSIFLTNYELFDDGSGQIQNPKVNDGGIYVKFITRSEYNQNTEYPLPIPIDVKPLNLLALTEFDSSAEEIGFDIFGGPYGIQTFDRLNYSFNTTIDGKVEEINDFDFKFMFYESPKNPERNNSLGQPSVAPINQYGLIDGPRFNQQALDEVLVFTNLLNLNETNFIEPYNNYGKNTEVIYQSIKQNKELTYPFIDFYVYSSDVKNRVSLFGSRFYYEQTINEAKAILFLHTFPWNGLVNSDEKFKSIFTRAEILNTFNKRAGFISVPKLWAAFIGGMLWRSKQTTEPIRFYNPNDPFIPFMDDNPDSYPTQKQYLTSPNSSLTNIAAMVFESGFSPIYLNLGDTLLSLPDQAKDEFIRVFENFVRDDWNNIKSKLEISKNPSSWKQTWNNIHGSLRVLAGGKYENLVFVKKQLLKDSFNNFDNYIRISPMWDSLDNEYDYNYILQLKDNVNINKEIISLYKEEIILINTKPNIWTTNKFSLNKERGDISTSENNFNLYINTILGKIKGSTTNYTYDTEQAQNEIFGNTNENLIKLQLYRTCKNIYDKWVGYSNDEDVMFQCGGRNLVDTALANKRSTNGANNEKPAKPRLIDSFRFVTRSFEDIGDVMAINPTPLVDYLSENINTSSYDMITSLLSANNFDFVPLPSFINYRDPDALKSVFKPYPNYTEVETSDFSGPSFVCVYVGQTSNSLDFNNSNYPNDGFDYANLPPDFTGDAKDYEDVNAFFKVGFGQQNQNIFKDVVLDQSEFGETAESLQIIDDISQKGGEQNKSFGGQNLYNVYSVRSYKAEIEMMGNAMIQPMMYFQLDNIPMFHGAYMITRVKHSIKPNTMSTNFTGVRIKTTKSPIFDTSDFYMSFLETINAGESTLSNNLTTTGLKISGTFPPIVVTLIETGGANGYFGNIIEANKLKTPEIPIGITYLDVAVENRQLITQAAEALKPMLTAWLTWMKNNGFVGNNGTYAGITSMFRTIEKQRQLKASLGDSAAEPGTSMHGWGLAVDFQFYTKNGTRISNYKDKKPNLNEGFNYEINKSLVWLVENSYKYGWLIPKKLRDGEGTLNEFWHFEYHGKSAPCFIRADPKYISYPDKSKSIVIDTNSLGIFGGILNPTDKDGKEAIYTNCEAKYVNKSDGTGNVTSAAFGNIVPADSQLTMVTSLSGDFVARATTIIKTFKGFSSGTTLDAGTYRGGYGTDKIVVSEDAPPVKVLQGTTFTLEQATWSLSYDIEKRFAPLVISNIGTNEWTLLNDNQKASLISYAYNAGPLRLIDRGISAAIKAKDYTLAAKLIGDGPITSDGEMKPGLVKRRKIESLIFAKAV
jgi:GH24 family phage-related lysozyme (muramidase)